MPEASRKTDLLGVQLVDVLAQLEAMFRHEREMQQEAMRVRGVPSTLNHDERRKAGAAMRGYADQMERDCKVLCDLVRGLGVSVRELEGLLGATP